MHGLDTIHSMNNESEKNANNAAEALTYAEIQAMAKKELQTSDDYLAEDNNWPEPRNE